MNEYRLKIAPKSESKVYNLFKLHEQDEIDWSDTKMRRENPFQPWQMKVGSGRSARRFKATKEGGVSDNASYYIFYKPEGTNTYEVCPVEDWFKISATQRYTTLTAEEAEQQFEARNKTLNFFSLMKKNEEDADEDHGSSFKVTELDEFDLAQESGSDAEDNSDNRKKRKNSDVEEAPSEGKEDSDDGDDDGEVDYMSDSSSSSEEEQDDKTNIKGIAEEDALKDLLETDDEEEESAQNVSETRHASDESSDSEDYDVDEEKMDSMLPSVEPLASTSKRKVQPVDVPPPPPPKRPCPVEPQTQSSGLEKIVEDLIRKYLIRKPMALKTLLKDVKSKLKRMDKVLPDMDKELVNTIADIMKRLNLERQKINDVTYFSLKE